ncbi:hypothetical protein P8807_20555 [Bacillus subtilis]|uniref:hypothetical protein n=1 Tax=Bacillus subtilis TaxID=1423 RepID=UPI000B57E08E|nr:hypothetical protein [Bacillus subtilis]ARW33018.1 hypothetical protein S101441_03498 [Bacillus subtilis subsp. subtilis]MEC0318355.1 hypothetical protein [Bacillus subtilis]MEC0326648.1 hypothetical protein [Bacillus subtilis]MEC0348149.1 hypothetical protein [Bacillus subtilis]MEC0352848.1 hypothetical protein [Bacillus subtilis]
MKRVVLKENMIDDNELVIFEAGISYSVVDNAITNENEITVPLKDIWVDFETVKEGPE